MSRRLRNVLLRSVLRRCCGVAVTAIRALPAAIRSPLAARASGRPRFVVVRVDDLKTLEASFVVVPDGRPAGPSEREGALLCTCCSDTCRGLYRGRIARLAAPPKAHDGVPLSRRVPDTEGDSTPKDVSPSTRRGVTPFAPRAASPACRSRHPWRGAASEGRRPHSRRLARTQRPTSEGPPRRRHHRDWRATVRPDACGPPSPMLRERRPAGFSESRDRPSGPQ